MSARRTTRSDWRLNLFSGFKSIICDVEMFAMVALAEFAIAVSKMT